MKYLMLYQEYFLKLPIQKIQLSGICHKSSESQILCNTQWNSQYTEGLGYESH